MQILLVVVTRLRRGLMLAWLPPTIHSAGVESRATRRMGLTGRARAAELDDEQRKQQRIVGDDTWRALSANMA